MSCYNTLQDLEDYDKQTIDICERFNSLITNMNSTKVELVAAKYQLSSMREKFLRDRKKMYIEELDVSKNITRKEITDTLLISDQLCVFLGFPIGTISNRTKIFNLICEYIKNNNLQNNTSFRLDSKLALLFGNKGEKLTFFSIQTRLSPHLCPISKIDLKNETL